MKRASVLLAVAMLLAAVGAQPCAAQGPDGTWIYDPDLPVTLVPSERLTDAQVRQVRTAGTESLQRCWGGEREHNATGPVRVRFDLTIERAGNVSSARTLSDASQTHSAASPALRECLERAATSWVFPPCLIETWLTFSVVFGAAPR